MAPSMTMTEGGQTHQPAYMGFHKDVFGYKEDDDRRVMTSP